MDVMALSLREKHFCRADDNKSDDKVGETITAPAAYAFVSKVMGNDCCKGCCCCCCRAKGTWNCWDGGEGDAVVGGGGLRAVGVVVVSHMVV